MNILVKVTLYDETTGKVEEQIVEHYDGSYSWEVSQMFDLLGEKVAKKFDPEHE